MLWVRTFLMHCNFHIWDYLPLTIYRISCNIAGFYSTFNYSGLYLCTTNAYGWHKMCGTDNKAKHKKFTLWQDQHTYICLNINTTSSPSQKMAADAKTMNEYTLSIIKHFFIQFYYCFCNHVIFLSSLFLTK